MKRTYLTLLALAALALAAPASPARTPTPSVSCKATHKSKLCGNSATSKRRNTQAKASKTTK